MAKEVQGRARICERRPKKWAAKNANDANVDRVRTLVRSYRRVGVRIIAEEFTLNRETVRQIVKEDLGKRKFSTKIVP
jgi:DNA-directed RNA polymerase sigma subunit (sigma70/sigma32)